MVAVVGAPGATPEGLGGSGKGGIGWVRVVGTDDAGVVDLGWLVSSVVVLGGEKWRGNGMNVGWS